MGGWPAPACTCRLQPNVFIVASETRSCFTFHHLWRGISIIHSQPELPGLHQNSQGCTRTPRVARHSAPERSQALLPRRPGAPRGHRANIQRALYSSVKSCEHLTPLTKTNTTHLLPACGFPSYDSNDSQLWTSPTDTGSSGRHCPDRTAPAAPPPQPLEAHGRKMAVVVEKMRGYGSYSDRK